MRKIKDRQPTKTFQTMQHNLSSTKAFPIHAQFGQPSKVLIIDDNPTIIEIAKHTLQNAGYKVVAHMTSLEAIITIMYERPDLILLDIKMPLIDGLMTCRLIKKNQMIAKTPILLYSALNEKTLSKKVTEYGAQGYIHKSWSMEKVVNTIAKHLTPALFLKGEDSLS